MERVVSTSEATPYQRGGQIALGVKAQEIACTIMAAINPLSQVTMF